MISIPCEYQLITYYLPVCYLLRIQQYPVNTTYNNHSKVTPCQYLNEPCSIKSFNKVVYSDPKTKVNQFLNI